MCIRAIILSPIYLDIVSVLEIPFIHLFTHFTSFLVHSSLHPDGTYVHNRDQCSQESFVFYLSASVNQDLENGNYHAVVGAFEYNIAIPTEKAGIPYLVHSFGSSSARRANTFYMLPGVEDICDCVKDLVQAFKWQRMAIFYEDIIGEIQRNKVFVKLNCHLFVNVKLYFEPAIFSVNVCIEFVVSLVYYIYLFIWSI